MRLIIIVIEGGINCIEITFDHTGDDGINNTLSCFEKVSNCFGDQVVLGAGTVLTAEEVKLAKRHNVQYIISPNTDKSVIATTKDEGMLSMPGALTPTEVVAAYHYGADIVKLFPIDTLGASYLKAIKSPLKHIPVSAVGGVTLENMNTYMENGAVCVGIGGNLVNTRLIESGEFDKIFRHARAFYERANN